MQVCVGIFCVRWSKYAVGHVGSDALCVHWSLSSRFWDPRSEGVPEWCRYTPCVFTQHTSCEGERMSFQNLQHFWLLCSFPVIRSEISMILIIPVAVIVTVYQYELKLNLETNASVNSKCCSAEA
jgi:hypothetical protein